MDTLREMAPELATNDTRSAELPGLIATEVERAISKTWDDGGLRNVIEATLNESFKNSAFTKPLVELFLNNPRFRENL